MSNAGEKLKETRLKQGKTIRDIAEQTRISVHFLEAIEAGDLEAIPGEFFRRSFLRQYASALGLNPEDFQLQESMEFRSLGTDAGAALPAVHMHELPDLPPLPAMGQRRGLPWKQMLLSVGLLVGVLAVCAVAYTLWEEYEISRGRQEAASAPALAPPVSTAGAQATDGAADPAAPVDPAETAVSPEIGNQVAVTPPTATPDSSDRSEITTSGEAAPPIDPAAGGAEPRVHGTGARELRLSASAPVWVQAREGDRTVFVGVLQPGETRILRLQEGGRLLVGNAGGLSLVWQGEDSGAVGPVGQVRIVTLTPEGLSVTAPVKNPTQTESSGAAGS